MILADFLRPEPGIQWALAKECGVDHAVVPFPEDHSFDVTDRSHVLALADRFKAEGLTPVVVEPMPNHLHDHIKTGDEKRDESIEKVIKMLPNLRAAGIDTICFNFMAHIGWLRTSSDLPERGGALVTGFDLQDFRPTDKKITAEELWENYFYFIKAVLPYAEKEEIRLALHPDDPPLMRLGDVERIMISYENIRKAIDMVKSPMLGVTMCQACYAMMGEDLDEVIPALKEKIFFIHFRNVVGNKYKFRETFHDNGKLDMAHLIGLYTSLGIDVPIRVDHVPTMASDNNSLPGYSTTGRLFAIGYLKGLLERAK